MQKKSRWILCYAYVVCFTIPFLLLCYGFGREGGLAQASAGSVRVLGSVQHVASECLSVASQQQTSGEAGVPVVFIEPPSKVVDREIQLLMDGDTATVQRYFGASDIYTADAVSETVSATKVTFLASDAPEPMANGLIQKGEASLYTQYVHFCTLDYNRLSKDMLEFRASIPQETQKEDYNNLVTSETAKRVQSGDYDLHITMGLLVRYDRNGVGSVEVTEAYKIVLTGGWYNPTDAVLQSGGCPLVHETD